MFFKKLEKLVKENDITMNKLAKNAGFSQANTDRWKKGSMPNTEALIKICKYLNVSADYLLDLENEAPPPQLTDQEQEMINNFRLCDSGTRENIELLARSGAEKALKQERLLNSEKAV